MTDNPFLRIKASELTRMERLALQREGFLGSGIEERRQRVQNHVDAAWKHDSLQRILNVLSHRMVNMILDEHTVKFSFEWWMRRS